MTALALPADYAELPPSRQREARRRALAALETSPAAPASDATAAASFLVRVRGELEAFAAGDDALLGMPPARREFVRELLKTWPAEDADGMARRRIRR